MCQRKTTPCITMNFFPWLHIKLLLADYIKLSLITWLWELVQVTKLCPFLFELGSQTCNYSGSYCSLHSINLKSLVHICYYINERPLYHTHQLCCCRVGKNKMNKFSIKTFSFVFSEMAFRQCADYSMRQLGCKSKPECSFTQSALQCIDYTSSKCCSGWIPIMNICTSKSANVQALSMDAYNSLLLV